MQQPEALPPSPLSVGDVVQPKPDCDFRFLFMGERTKPGPIVGFTEFGGHKVREPDGREFPYAPYELEAVDG